ncbi:hypothetical protein M011DRAFT_91302 [Sporormia fimetaria CBS 119925]|uniref:Uncharacterized protein n=1 Tax=Sporormia fimetaria CBS 119925 TaxID=1340428 RepID=A0A6A6V880_9PLEO|nr:hypothetical protein M011DRAFT_91302 [Sporormia fimetaria CBS 119925]
MREMSALTPCVTDLCTNADRLCRGVFEIPKYDARVSRRVARVQMISHGIPNAGRRHVHARMLRAAETPKRDSKRPPTLHPRLYTVCGPPPDDPPQPPTPAPRKSLSGSHSPLLSSRSSKHPYVYHSSLSASRGYLAPCPRRSRLRNCPSRRPCSSCGLLRTWFLCVL